MAAERKNGFSCHLPNFDRGVLQKIIIERKDSFCFEVDYILPFLGSFDSEIVQSLQTIDPGLYPSPFAMFKNFLEHIINMRAFDIGLAQAIDDCLF